MEFEPPIGGAIANFELREMQFYFTYEKRRAYKWQKTFKVYYAESIKIV